MLLQLSFVQKNLLRINGNDGFLSFKFLSLFVHIDPIHVAQPMCQRCLCFSSTFLLVSSVWLLYVRTTMQKKIGMNCQYTDSINFLSLATYEKLDGFWNHDKVIPLSIHFFSCRRECCVNEKKKIFLLFANKNKVLSKVYEFQVCAYEESYLCCFFCALRIG